MVFWIMRGDMALSRDSSALLRYSRRISRNIRVHRKLEGLGPWIPYKLFTPCLVLSWLAQLGLGSRVPVCGTSLCDLHSSQYGGFRALPIFIEVQDSRKKCAETQHNLESTWLFINGLRVWSRFKLSRRILPTAAVLQLSFKPRQPCNYQHCFL